MSPTKGRDLASLRDHYWGSLRSARSVIPVFNELYGPPRSVIDVGGGLMAWLEVFGENGAEILLGVDSIPAEALPLSKFTRKYQEADLSEPVAPNERFDVAVCLEVGTYLEPSGRQNLVRLLSIASDRILFSAGIPGQSRSVDVHGDWQSAWAATFIQQGFAVDLRLRDAIWNNDSVEWWYRQNMMVFVKRPAKSAVEAGATLASVPLDVVHPAFFAEFVARGEKGTGAIGQLLSAKHEPPRSMKSLIMTLSRLGPLGRVIMGLRSSRVARAIWNRLT